jgi:hypothetical protein
VSSAVVLEDVNAVAIVFNAATTTGGMGVLSEGTFTSATGVATLPFCGATSLFDARTNRWIGTSTRCGWKSKHVLLVLFPPAMLSTITGVDLTIAGGLLSREQSRVTMPESSVRVAGRQRTPNMVRWGAVIQFRFRLRTDSALLPVQTWRLHRVRV